ncbi:TauD/TfdA family dioxygenase [Streptomyces triculaminicus]|uniref:TauD/TfdA family dioxygenase n=1 Tax=Streptomyces triculaminicus TaxID=2816232 RepID=UPI0037D91187
MNPAHVTAPSKINGRQRRSPRLFNTHLVTGWDSDAPQVIAEQLERTGLVTFTGLTTAEAIADLAAQVMDTSRHQTGGSFGLHWISDTRAHAHRADGAVRTREAVDLHTCGSIQREPPRLVLLACVQKGRTGGELLLADGRAVFADLRQRRPDAASALSLPRAAHFGHGADSLFSQVFKLVAGQVSGVRLRQDGFIRWPEDTQPFVPVLRSVLAEHRRAIALRRGYAVLLDNARWLHGRAAVTGNRLFYRAEGQLLPPPDSESWLEASTW